MLNSKMKDITGERFGNLVALYPTEKRVGRNVVWRFRCDCGNEIETVVTNVKSGNKKNCGCSHGNEINLIGQRFGKLVVVEKTDERNPYNGSIIWKCHCDCGNNVFVAAHLLKTSSVVSCGCHKFDSVKDVVKSKRSNKLKTTCHNAL